MEMKQTQTNQERIEFYKGLAEGLVFVICSIVIIAALVVASP